MAGMEQVETAVGEADAQALAPPALDLGDGGGQRRDLGLAGPMSEWCSAATSSSVVATAVPTLPTTMPAAMLARRAASSGGAPTATAAAITATTVSPAPDTSNTSRASAGR